MGKVTTKLQVTVPKSIAERYGIRPGDELEWLPAGESIRVLPARATKPTVDLKARLALFRAAMQRQRRRQAGRRAARPASRGWTREELYDRGRPH
ncbi:MAG: AbrB/MazE/SpoVT family DNA-binding domain-containing protein [Myxococcales bacterium]|nr:AbrB/MazE/SpoVT family DNA-binding domain-containing protein [Myxococcales bacterium]